MLARVRLFATPWTVACQAPLSMGFSRQEYWSGLPLPPSGNLSDPEIELMRPASPALEDGFVAQLLKDWPTMQTWDLFLGWEVPTPVFWPGEFHGLHVHRVTKRQTRLSRFHFHSLGYCATRVPFFCLLELLQEVRA